jgi:hypothetical protein
MHHTRVFRAAEQHRTVGESGRSHSSLLVKMVAKYVRAASMNASKAFQAFFVSILMVEWLHYPGVRQRVK